MTEYVYKIPEKLMCNLPLHNRHVHIPYLLTYSMEQSPS